MTEELTTRLICEECGADFIIEHEMGFDYIPNFCVFCRSEIDTEEVFNAQQRMLEEH